MNIKTALGTICIGALAGSLVACPGPEPAAFDCETQDEAFMASYADDGVLLPEIPDKTTFPMALVLSEVGINNLLTGINGVKTALGDGVLEKYGVDPTEVVKEIFGALGHKDGGRFFKFDGDQDPRVAALEAEKQQLQAALDAKYPPELLAAQVDEIRSRIGKTDADKVAKMVEAIYSSMQAGEVIASAPQVAPVADEIMKAGGYQTPTPIGVDPNFPQPSPMQQVGMQAAAAGPVDIPESGNTSPMFPATTGSPSAGANEGIESEAYANGGVVGKNNSQRNRKPGVVGPHNALLFDPPQDPRSEIQHELGELKDDE